MNENLVKNLTSIVDPDAARPMIEFLSPLELRDYVMPDGLVLVGNCHITRGAVFVIGGTPGVGKSRSAVALAQAGATGKDWFGLKVHRQFKTMIIQNENGRYRLSREFFELECEQLNDWIRVCPPPPMGLAFDNPEFQKALIEEIKEFKPDVIIIDPWNAVAPDDKAKEYLATFDLIRRLLPTGDDGVAIGIVAHTRKPKSDERSAGRSLLNLLAGSYVLGSVPRSVFIMQPASDDPVDDRVVWTCCKNNDGDLGDRSAWVRKNGLFEFADDFDWEEFDKPSETRKTVTEENLRELFAGGIKLAKRDAVTKLMAISDCKHSVCYAVLKKDGKFKKILTIDADGLIGLKE